MGRANDDDQLLGAFMIRLALALAAALAVAYFATHPQTVANIHSPAQVQQ
jgi:hypothetical protein